MSALAIKNLHKVYDNGLVALKGINLEVQAGDFFALLGPNGAGKSTAIGIICSLVRKSSGSVSVFGSDLDLDPYEARRMIGLVPQEFNFNQFERVQEIVVNQGGYYGVPRAVALKRSLKILTQLDLLDKRDTEARALSGGMKRRLMIARALIHQPKLLILDEPTAGVDLEIRHSMWNFLREINGSGTTIILTTHYLEEAESLCRNIAIINDGEIIEHAGMPQLLDRLHGDCFLMNVESPPDSLPEIEGIQLSFYEEDQIQVEVPAGYSLNKLFGELSAHGINVRSIRNKQNRLEQMFLKLIRQNGNGDAS